MSDVRDTSEYSVADAAVVEAQLGRVPREPWRVGARCQHGYPTVVVSPGVLEDGTPFPTYAWLTCPHLSDLLSVLETAGAAAGWAARATTDADVAERLVTTDVAVRVARAVESGGADPCSSVGLAGQADPLGVKCLHAHVALALIGIDDPVGVAELAMIRMPCTSKKCSAYLR